MRMRRDELTPLYKLELHDDKLAKYAETPQNMDSELLMTFSLRPNWEYNGRADDGAYTPVVEAYINNQLIASHYLGFLTFTSESCGVGEKKALALAREQIGLTMKRMQMPMITLFDSMFAYSHAAFSVPLDGRKP